MSLSSTTTSLRQRQVMPAHQTLQRVTQAYVLCSRTGGEDVQWMRGRRHFKSACASSDGLRLRGRCIDALNNDTVALSPNACLTQALLVVRSLLDLAGIHSAMPISTWAGLNLNTSHKVTKTQGLQEQQFCHNSMIFIIFIMCTVIHVSLDHSNLITPQELVVVENMTF